MKTYTKPIAEKISFTYENQVVAESSTVGSSCYDVNAYIHQTPEPGRDSYVIQANGQHHSDHTREHQVLMISFNMPVTYLKSNGTLKSGDGTPTLYIDYYYHQNPNDNIGLGELHVKAGAGLAITGVVLTD